MKSMRGQGLLCFLLLLSLSSCFTSGYKMPRAIIHIDLSDSVSSKVIIDQVAGHLDSLGFVDSRIYYEELRMVRNKVPAAEMKERLAKMRERLAGSRYQVKNFKLPDSKIKVSLVSYDFGADRSRISTYADVAKPVIEINIYERQPGGFSGSGIVLFENMNSFLQDDLNLSARTIQEPKPQDPKVARDHNYKTILEALIVWSVVFMFSFVIFGFIINLILNKLPVRESLKGIYFIILGTLIISPMPTPVAITFLLLPNIVLFPWFSYLSYYQQIPEYAACSFLATAALCACYARSRK